MNQKKKNSVFEDFTIRRPNRKPDFIFDKVKYWIIKKDNILLGCFDLDNGYCIYQAIKCVNKLDKDSDWFNMYKMAIFNAIEREKKEII